MEKALKRKIVVILDNIRSRENVGSIFRTADAAGIDKIYLCGITPAPPHLKISKTALGAEQYIPWEHHKACWRLLEKLHQKDFCIIALENIKKAKNIFFFKKLGKSVALVLGSEVKGLSPQILKRCNIITQIPMKGKKESLNVSVAFGIAVYQLSKNR